MVSSVKLTRLQKQRERLLRRRQKQEEQLRKLRQESRQEEKTIDQQIIDEKYAVMVNLLKKMNFPMDDDNAAFLIGLALEAVDIIRGDDQDKKTSLLNKYQDRYLHYLEAQESAPADTPSPAFAAEGM